MTRSKPVVYLAQFGGGSDDECKFILRMALHPFDDDLTYFNYCGRLPNEDRRYPFRVVYLYQEMDPCPHDDTSRLWRYSCRGIGVHTHNWGVDHKDYRYNPIEPAAGFPVVGNKHVKCGSIDAAIAWLLEGE